MEGFYIDPEHQWQITMNLANTPLLKNDKEYIDYFYTISLHEVSHYEVIPYDGLMHAKLLKGAMQYVNQHFAPIVVNVFADLVIDTLLYKKYPELMLWEMKTSYDSLFEKYQGNFSPFSMFLHRAYERIWDADIVRNVIPTNIDNIAKRVVNVIKKDLEDESTWEEKVPKIARHMNTLIKDTFTLIGPSNPSEDGKRKKNAPGGMVTMDIPEDLLEIMDNPLDTRNGDTLKEENEDEKRRKAEDFANETNYSEFGAPAGQAGLLIDGNPLATWYRGLAKNLIEIRIFEEKPGGQVPVYIEPWRIGDPIEELDIVQTLLTSPYIIPNVTTRKWKYKEGQGHLVEKQIPDLLLVLDSSGSMAWNYHANTDYGRGQYHIALVAAFAALHHAASKGSKFSVINFSNRADTCNWTTNYDEAEKILLRYQGGGTHLPIKDIKNQCLKAERKSLVFIITDFGIYNWGPAKKIMIELANMGHKIVGFFIGSSTIPKDRFKDLLDKVTLYPIKNTKDLINLVIEEIKKYY